MENCDKGWPGSGQCCCNCMSQKKLMCHPWNKNFGQGSISEQCGWVCTIHYDDDEDGTGKNEAIFFDKEHGYCELHVPRVKRMTCDEMLEKVREDRPDQIIHKVLSYQNSPFGYFDVAVEMDMDQVYGGGIVTKHIKTVIPYPLQDAITWREKFEVVK